MEVRKPNLDIPDVLDEQIKVYSYKYMLRYIQMTISSNQAHDFWNKGYCVNRIDVSDVLHAIEAYAAPRTLQYDFGTDPALNFPCIPELGAINELAVNELLIAAAQTLLGSSVKLIQCVGWAKHGLDEEDDSDKQSNSDQRMHFDAYNNTLLCSPPFETPNVVAAIVYLSDTVDAGGGTAIVPRQGSDDKWYHHSRSQVMPGVGGRPFMNNRAAAETMMTERGEDRTELYEREVIHPFKVGDVLFYRHDVWHRGTPVKPGKTRWVVNLAWAKRDAQYVLTWGTGLARKMYYDWLEAWIASLSPLQLGAVGFPPPSDPVWEVRGMREGVQARYASYGFDLDAYLKLDNN
jgi:hypothetical protein